MCLLHTGPSGLRSSSVLISCFVCLWCSACSHSHSRAVQMLPYWRRATAQADAHGCRCYWIENLSLSRIGHLGRPLITSGFKYALLSLRLLAQAWSQVDPQTHFIVSAFVRTARMIGPLACDGHGWDDAVLIAPRTTFVVSATMPLSQCGEGLQGTLAPGAGHVLEAVELANELPLVHTFRRHTTDYLNPINDSLLTRLSRLIDEPTFTEIVQRATNWMATWRSVRKNAPEHVCKDDVAIGAQIASAMQTVSMLCCSAWENSSLHKEPSLATDGSTMPAAEPHQTQQHLRRCPR